MKFNRFDICEAYYVFAADYHSGQGSKVYKIFGRLQNINFDTSPLINKERLSVNGKAIYDNLVREWQKK